MQHRSATAPSRFSTSTPLAPFRHPAPAALFFFLFILLGLAALPAAASPDSGVYSPDALPQEYGEIIYRLNEQSPKQLYIIGISHRDPASGANGTTTVHTQADIFRIGEWLNRHRDLELLLPEGYFRERRVAPHSPAHPAVSAPPRATSPLTKAALIEKLADQSRFVNAEMLLIEHCDMHASQVENRRIYDAVRTSLAELTAPGFERTSATDGIARLRYLQEVRTSMLLQNIPETIEFEILNGAVRHQQAMFTIGLHHIHDIIRYLEKTAIKLDAPRHGTDLVPDLAPELTLLTEGYGITIIIPRTLADNRPLLRMTNLDRILSPAEERIASP